MPGSIPDHACRPNRSEFYLVFSSTGVSTGSEPLERHPLEDIPLIVPGPTSGQMDLNLQPTNLEYLNIFIVVENKLSLLFYLYKQPKMYGLNAIKKIHNIL